MNHLYAEISKTEELSDGTIKVYGFASSGAIDSDGEIITADAMKAALPDYMKFGAVREMHTAKAAGTAIEASVGEDGRTFFGALIVDAEAVKKVKAGVYKGFSIGGKVTERDLMNKSIIKGLNLVEVSLVDRPANPEAVFTMYKADGLSKEEIEMTEDDAAKSEKTEVAADDAEQVEKSDETVEDPAVDELAEMLNKGEITAEKLVDLAKNGVPAPMTFTEQVAKGMYSVADFASLLSQIKWLLDDVSWEAAYEGDDSTMPAKIKSWLESGAKLLVAMVKEEVAELTADKSETADDIQKVQTADLLAKFAQLTDTVQKHQDSNALLTDEITKLKAKPMPGKALLKAITKETDAVIVLDETITKTEVAKLPEGASGEEVAKAMISDMYKK